ncbi:MAG: MBL fold metallo-hydrolase [bacterium]|nr:MBL fold metallo-hydrolase [bacterium]
MIKLQRIVVGPLETNAYILSLENEGVIVDPGAEADKIIAACDGLYVKIILLTHNHFDHTQALIDVKNALNVRAGIHPLEVAPLDKTSNIFDFEINDGAFLKFGKTSIKVIHTPGHTPGSCCFLIENILLSGDTIFCGGYGNTELPGGDERDILKSIRNKIMILPPDTKICPGHGPPTTVGEEMPLYL